MGTLMGPSMYRQFQGSSIWGTFHNICIHMNIHIRIIIKREGGASRCRLLSGTNTNTNMNMCINTNMNINNCKNNGISMNINFCIHINIDINTNTHNIIRIIAGLHIIINIRIHILNGYAYQYVYEYL